MSKFLISLLLPHVSAAVLGAIKDGLHAAARKAAETKTPYDDMLVRALAQVLGINLTKTETMAETNKDWA